MARGIRIREDGETLQRVEECEERTGPVQCAVLRPPRGRKQCCVKGCRRMRFAGRSRCRLHEAEQRQLRELAQRRGECVVEGCRWNRHAGTVWCAFHQLASERPDGAEEPLPCIAQGCGHVRESGPYCQWHLTRGNHEERP